MDERADAQHLEVARVELISESLSCGLAIDNSTVIDSGTIEINDSDEDVDITVLDIQELVEQEEKKEALCVVDLTGDRYDIVSDDSLLDDIIDITDEVQASKARKLSIAAAVPQKAVLKELARPASAKQAVIAVDTNVFVDALNYIRWIRTAQSQMFSSVQLLVPWTVIKELDFLKMRRDRFVHDSSRKAIRYLNQCLVSKDPLLVVQTPHEEMESSKLMTVNNNDDRILCCCLLWQLKLDQLGCRENIFLLSNDINLRNKALIMDVKAYGSEDMHAKLQLTVVQSQSVRQSPTSVHHASKAVVHQVIVTPVPLPQSTHSAKRKRGNGIIKHNGQASTSINGGRSTSVRTSPPKKKQKTSNGAATISLSVDAPNSAARAATDLRSLTKIIHAEAWNKISQIMIDFLGDLLVDELKKKYQSNWEATTLHKPPWTLMNLLECFEHDTAVVESMPLKNKQKQFLMGLRAFLAGKHVNDGLVPPAQEMNRIIEGCDGISARLSKRTHDIETKDKLLKIKSDLIELRRKISAKQIKHEARLAANSAANLSISNGQEVVSKKERRRRAKAALNSVQTSASITTSSSMSSPTDTISPRKASLRSASHASSSSSVMPQSTGIGVQQAAVVFVDDDDDDVKFLSTSAATSRPTEHISATAENLAQDSAAVILTLAWHAIRNWRNWNDKLASTDFRETVMRLGCFYERVLQLKAGDQQAKAACTDLCDGLKQFSGLLGQDWPRLAPEMLLTSVITPSNKEVLEASHQQLEELTRGFSYGCWV